MGSAAPGGGGCKWDAQSGMGGAGFMPLPGYDGWAAGAGSVLLQGCNTMTDAASENSNCWLLFLRFYA